MSNDWDELFAMAEGAGDAEKEEPEAPDGEMSLSQSKNKRKRKRKEKDSSAGSRLYQEASNEMLKARMNVPREFSVWPDWLSIGGAFSSSTTSQCSKFESSQNGGISRDIPTVCCQNCQQSALHHIVHATANHSCLHIFCNLRNLRAIAKVLVVQSETAKMSKQLSKILQEQLHQLKRYITSQLTQEVPAHESSLLESKVLAISKYANQVAGISSSKKSNTANSPSIDNLVRLIIACDDLYYRLYYLQITNQLPPMAWSDNDDNNNKKGLSGFIFLPHPTEYFGLPHLVSDQETEAQYCRGFLTSLKDEGRGGDGGNLARCSQRVGCHLGTDKNETEVNKLHPLLHPLSAIRRFRFLETVSLFHTSGWYKSTNTHDQVVKALNQGSSDGADDENDEEETPAPLLLSEWRDSCRDFLCHLYAYATLSEKSLTAITNFAKGGIVEYGAGTGYLAFCLESTYKVDVAAYDVCPTPEEGSSSRDSPLNDYHGQTPCFSKVQKGDLGTLSKDLKENNVDAWDKTLLLCYPPPKSSMAYDILKAFTEHGGKTFIHIGEFRGLTGDKDFEQYLLHNFECHERYPCYSWGTDASEVTLWKRKRESKNSSPEKKMSLLLPCSFCGEREAVKRFRMLRYLVYCSKKCCKKDSVARREHLLLQMVDVPDTSRIDFKDERQFSVLRGN